MHLPLLFSFKIRATLHHVHVTYVTNKIIYPIVHAAIRNVILFCLGVAVVENYLIYHLIDTITRLDTRVHRNNDKRTINRKNSITV